MPDNENDSLARSVRESPSPDRCPAASPFANGEGASPRLPDAELPVSRPTRFRELVRRAVRQHDGDAIVALFLQDPRLAQETITSEEANLRRAQQAEQQEDDLAEGRAIRQAAAQECDVEVHHVPDGTVDDFQDGSCDALVIPAPGGDPAKGRTPLDPAANDDYLGYIAAVGRREEQRRRG